MITRLWISNHTMWIVEAIAGLVLVGILIVFWLRKRKPSSLNVEEFNHKWHEAQALCASKATWPLAIISADALLDEALKKLRFKGKTMGERLVSAQHEIKNNDGIWFAHKLRNKLVSDDPQKLKKKDVVEALVGIRAALRDLGALQ